MKIALLTLPTASNYGNILQAYALGTCLRRLGHEVKLVDNRKTDPPVGASFLRTAARRALEACFRRKDIFWEWNLQRRIEDKLAYINRFVYDRLPPRTFPVVTEEDFRELAARERFDLWIIGSDQVWRPRFAAGHAAAFFGSFLDGSAARRITYAASFGTDACEYTPEMRSRCTELLRQFEGVTVREESGIRQCREYFAYDGARRVLDPTMLLTAADYDSLLSLSERRPSDALYCYLFNFKFGAKRLLENFAQKHGLRIVRTTDRPQQIEGRMPGVERWLEELRDAPYVITDSFHACVFCILYHKQFAAYVNRRRGAARIEGLLALFGLEGRILQPGARSLDLLEEPIDWRPVDRILDEQRKLSLRFLREHTANR